MEHADIIRNLTSTALALGLSVSLAGNNANTTLANDHSTVNFT